MIDKYLPIGTVVLLKGAKKRMMITGYGLQSDGTGKIYDYSSCLYPEGVISLQNSFAFDHDQIEHIFFIGFADEEQKDFQNKLKQIISMTQNENIESKPAGNDIQGNNTPK